MTVLSSDLPTFSASKIKTFSACKRKYYYSYIVREAQKRNPAAAMGTCVHKTVESFHRGELSSPDDLWTVYNNEWRRELQSSADLLTDGRVSKLQREGVAILERYDWTRHPRDVEIVFTLPYPDELFPLCYITGIIDQTYDDGHIEDLKTSRNRPLQGILDYDPQFIIYNWAYDSMYREPASGIYWHHLRTGDMIEAHVQGKDQFDSVQRIVEEMLEFHAMAERTGGDVALMERVYFRRAGDGCLFCGYRKACLGTE
jgi:hypothetical protein